MKFNFVNIIFIIWLFLIIFLIYQEVSKNDFNKGLKEGFTPKIRSFYNPHIRNARLYLESFTNFYNENYIIKRLKNMGIY